MAERSRRTVRDLRRGNRARVLQRLYFDGPLSRQELGPADRAEFGIHQQRGRRAGLGRAPGGGGRRRLRRRTPPHPAADRPGRRAVRGHRHRRDPGTGRAVRPLPHGARAHRPAAGPARIRRRAHRRPRPLGRLRRTARQPAPTPACCSASASVCPASSNATLRRPRAARVPSSTVRPSDGAPFPSSGCSGRPCRSRRRCRSSSTTARRRWGRPRCGSAAAAVPERPPSP